MLDATGEAHDEEGVMSALPSLPFFSACVSSSNIAARKQQQQQRFNNALTSSKLFPSGKRFGGGGNDDDDDGVIACSEKLVREEFSSLSSSSEKSTMIYCDYNGCPPVSSRLIQNCTRQHIESMVLGNPHSKNASASIAEKAIHESRSLVLKHFNAPEFGEYHCVFVNGGATNAVQLVGDAFFSVGKRDALSYAMDNHTSVVGLRNLVWSRGGDVFVLVENEEEEWTSVKVNDCGAKIKTKKKWFKGNKSNPRGRKHLLAYADESNFHGQGVREACVKRKMEEICREGSECFTLLDASKSAAMRPVMLKDMEKELRPDFIVASAYKMFGYPTGVGFLLVSNRAMEMIERNENMNRKYFGGGTAKAIDAKTNFFIAKENASGLERGTLPFQQIAALPKCFEWYQSIGGSEMIRINAGHVGEVLASRLWNLRHANGKPVVEIYGSQWRHLAEHLKNQSDYDDRYEKLTYDGRKIVSLSTVAFNVLNDDGTHVGYSKVERALASQNIVVRTGCCCNPGACESIRKKKIENRVKKLYETKGKVCGDDMGVDDTDGEPLGCVRASFGYASRVSDAKAIIETIEREFVCHARMTDRGANEAPETPSSPSSSSSSLVTISKINVFPIKSCAPFSVEKWYLLPSGLLFDRKYVLIEKQSGIPLSQKSYPQMVRITPSVETIDLEDVNGYAFTYLVLTCSGIKETLRIDLNEDGKEFDLSREGNVSVSIRGSTREARLVRDPAAHEWFSKVLNVECCLALLKDETKRTFANTSPILIASERSAKSLGCDISRFRANIIVSEKENEDVEKKRSKKKSSSNDNDLFLLEKTWISTSISNENVGIKIRDTVTLGNGRFCHRCESVAIDQTTGKRDEKTWEIIMRKAANTFGVSFDVLPNGQEEGFVSNTIAVGDEIHSVHSNYSAPLT